MTELAAKILELVTAHRHVSFVELQRLDGMRGDLLWSLGGDHRNIILWSGLSGEGIEAIEALLKEEKIHMNVASYLSYLLDGVSLTLPLAKTKRKYKTPHWLPIVFNPGADPKKNK